MPTALELIHLITPAVLSLPVLSLLPAPRAAPPEPEGIRAVTIKTVTPRRGWILLVLLALAATSAAEAVVLSADLLTANARGVSHSSWYIYTSAAHAIGGLTIYFLTAIVAEWRTRWGDKAIVLLALLAFGLEVPNLVLSVIAEVHSGEFARGTHTCTANLHLRQPTTCPSAAFLLVAWGQCLPHPRRTRAANLQHPAPPSVGPAPPPAPRACGARPQPYHPL